MGVGAKRHGGWRERKEGLCWSRVTDVSGLSSGTVEGATVRGRGADTGSGRVRRGQTWVCGGGRAALS